jgi:hypothetical protein
MKLASRQRELQLLASHGAASDVRHIDPATYQPQQPHATGRPPLRQNKTAALLNAADAILIADASDTPAERIRNAHSQEATGGRVVRARAIPSAAAFFGGRPIASEAVSAPDVILNHGRRRPASKRGKHRPR